MHISKLFGLVLSLLAGCSILEVDNLEVRTGYTTTDLKYQGRADIIPVRVSASITYLEPVLPSEYGELKPKIELITDTIILSETGYLAGVCPMLTYSYAFNNDFAAFIEAGAGPTYLSLETYEQGDPGFNFIDQIGAGLELNLGPIETTISYRFAHLSHAGLRDNRNRGIDAHSVLLGIKIPF